MVLETQYLLAQGFYRGSHPPVLKHFLIFTGKHLCWSLFSIKLQALKNVPRRLPHKRFHNTYFEKHLQTVLLLPVHTELLRQKWNEISNTKNYINYII